MEKNCMLVIEVHPGAKKALARITDGINIYLRGTIFFEKLNETLERVRKAKDDKELLEIGWDIGLGPPIC